MSYNPLEQDYQRHSLELKKCDLSVSQLQGAVQSAKHSLESAQKLLHEEQSWHSAQDESVLRDEETAIRMEIDNLLHQKRTLQLAIRHAESKQTQVRSRMGSDFNPLNWFSSTHKADKAELLSWSASESKSRGAVRTLSSRIGNKEKMLEDICAKQTRFGNFETTVGKIASELRELQQRLERLTGELVDAKEKRDLAKAALKAIKTQYDRVNASIKPLQVQIDQCYSDIDSSKAKLDLAAKFESELTAANSPKERKMIHASCERQLGDGSPSRVRDRQVGVIEGLQRTLEKLHKRALRLGKIASLDIKHIVIDGSNLMNADDQFIGLSAIEPLVLHLSQFYSVDIFFDPGATGVLQMSRSDLLSYFPDNVGVHITAGEADETILNYAGQPSSIVISRDGFVEYIDKHAVIEGRVFKPEIFNGRLLIVELDLELTYESAA